MLTDAEIVLYGILTLTIFENLFEIYVSLRQVSIYQLTNLPLHSRIRSMIDG